MTEDWEALKDAEDLAYFRAELAEVSPGNYPLEEKMRVLEDMREVSSEIENGMREDFARLDEVTQTMFLGRLGASGYRDRTGGAACSWMARGNGRCPRFGKPKLS